MKDVIESVTKLLQFLEVSRIDLLPGAYELKIDEKWYLAVNGQDRTVEVEPEGMMKMGIAPYNFCIWYNGWLAGLFDLINGGIFAAGTGANEETFCETVNDFITKKGIEDGKRDDG